jgi:hypothetical protein
MAVRHVTAVVKITIRIPIAVWQANGRSGKQGDKLSESAAMFQNERMCPFTPFAGQT